MPDFSHFNPKLAEFFFLLSEMGMGNKLYFIKFFQLLLKKFRPLVISLSKARFCDFSNRGYGNGFFLDWWLKLHDNSFQTPYSVSVEDFFLSFGSSSSYCVRFSKSSSSSSDDLGTLNVNGILLVLPTCSTLSSFCSGLSDSFLSAFFDFPSFFSLEFLS